MHLNSLPANDHKGDQTSGVSEQTRSLAQRLSGHMGLDAALKIATANQWHAVVTVLRDMQRTR